MTVLVSVKINDGVVMAADSASSFASGMVYRHADKIVNLRQGLPIGAMVTGAGGIGNESQWQGRGAAGLGARSGTIHSRRGREPPSHLPVRGEGRRLRRGGLDPSAAVRLLRGPAARRGLGDTAARAQLSGANPSFGPPRFEHVPTCLRLYGLPGGCGG
jgi:hypothetical protein